MGEVEWSPHELALWWTCEVMRDRLRHERWPDAVPASFARQFHQEERIFQWGNYQRSWFGAAGDVSNHSSMFSMGGFGAAGVAVGGAPAGAAPPNGSANGSPIRTSAAHHDVTEWRPIDQGLLYLSSHGYYLLPSTGVVLSFPLESMVQADVGGPGVLLGTYSMANGSQEQFSVASVWAELLFVMWAHEHCPDHPRLTNLGFLPPEFVERVQASGNWTDSPLHELAQVR